MRLSAKNRYGLAAMVLLAKEYGKGKVIAVNNIAENLSISKIYLEQIFSRFREARLVISQKGAQGGYYLSLPPKSVTVYDIFLAVDPALFEKTEDTVSAGALNIEKAMRLTVFDQLEQILAATLRRVTLEEVTQKAMEIGADGYMYYL
ncbi:MAG: Rrf2 family transcriptional regulator [Peptococcaceae bacterium]|jgi:Rrf2 family protein|nr:Rrf2 family transcriptional regulator [Peptococcaceae bacterium]